MKPKILMVDDDQYLLDAAVMALKNEFEISTATSVSSAKAIFSKASIELVVVDLNFEGQEEDGIALIDFLQQKDPTVPVIVLSTDKSTFRVVSAMRRDLVDFIPNKEGDYRESLRLSIRRGLERRRQRLEGNKSSVFLTHSSRMKTILATVDKITASMSKDSSILIIGETGTGKEVLTKYVASKLKKSLVAANMASIPKETAESELFGHMAGAFTGAVKNKIGLIEQATNGIFFLDELGECSLEIQAKLLRALEQKEVRPVGATQTRKVDVQFIGATNKPLQQMTVSGEFRLDLYQRLSTFVLEIPPLRERPEDIILYATQFVEEFSQGKPFRLETEALDALTEYNWPGNVRELKMTIQRMIVLSPNHTIDKAAVKNAIGDGPAYELKINNGLTLSRKDILKASAIINALEKEDNNRGRAADLLGIHRVTFFRWIKQLGIDEIMENPILRERISAQRTGSL